MTNETARRLVMNSSRYRLVNGKVAVRDIALLRTIRSMQASAPTTTTTALRMREAA